MSEHGALGKRRTMNTIDLHPVAIDTLSNDNEGCLAFVNGRLVAVLTRLTPETHEQLALVGRWYLEALFSDPIGSSMSVTFADLDEFRVWLTDRCTDSNRQAWDLQRYA